MKTYVKILVGVGSVFLPFFLMIFGLLAGMNYSGNFGCFAFADSLFGTIG